MVFEIASVAELPLLAKKIVAFGHVNRVMLFYGDMGAGKTTLIKEICKTLGVEEEVSSPTFSIVNEYASRQGKVYHFDFYRLKTESEALDLGYEEYLYSGNYCLVEWPEKIEALLPDYYLEIRIRVTGESSREVLALHH